MGIGKLPKGWKKGGLSSALSGIGTKDADFGFDETEAAIVDYLNNVIAKLRASLESHDNIASRTLEQSIALENLVLAGSRYEVAISYEGYGVEVDEGRKPQGYSKENRAKLMPKIYRWINNKESLHSIAGDKKHQLSLAYAISTKILKKGTKGSKWLTSVVGKNGEKLSSELTAAISSALGRDVSVIVTKQAQDSLNGNNNR